MFAIPGWSSLAAAAPKTQTVATGKSESKAKHAESAAKQNKKRKRGNDKSKPVNVNSISLGEKPETSAEGALKSPSNGPDRSEKRQKIASGEQEVVQADDANSSAGNAEDLEKREKRKAKKREKRERLKASKNAAEDTTEDTTEAPKALSVIPATASSKPGPQLTPLQASMRQKLVSARFRHLNQTLYTTPSAHSLSLFKENPEMFQEYHEGFRRQVEVWPENPVDGYVAEIKARGSRKGHSKGHSKDQSKSDTNTGSDITPLPRIGSTCYIADLGCGDAALSTILTPFKKNLKLEIFSYDLQSPSPLVTIADIANLPLKDNSIDVAIFCLALMGTNWIDFIEESWRILHWKGELWISEIKSRFGRVSSKKRVDHSVGNRVKKPDKKTLKKIEEAEDEEGLMVEVDGNPDKNQETDVSAFVEVLRKRGFVLKDEGSKRVQKSVDMSNRMFVRMVLVKAVVPIKGKCVPIPKGMPENSWKSKGNKRFTEVEAEDDTHVSSEAGVLKPCVYKIR